MRKLTVFLVSGEQMETTNREINFNAWGIDIIIQDKETNNKHIYIPYENIKYIEEPTA